MKKIIFIFIFYFHTQFSFAADWIKFPVFKMVKTEYDSMFRLITIPQYSRVILDCQSFFNGFRLYNNNDDGEEVLLLSFYLNAKDCYAIYTYLIENLEHQIPICAELNLKAYKIYLRHGHDNCH